jgi:hypothetical protein
MTGRLTGGMASGGCWLSGWLSCGEGSGGGGGGGGGQW